MIYKHIIYIVFFKKPPPKIINQTGITTPFFYKNNPYNLQSKATIYYFNPKDVIFNYSKFKKQLHALVFCSLFQQNTIPTTLGNE